MGPYKPLRTWVEFPIPYYMGKQWELIDPIAHVKKKAVRLPPTFNTMACTPPKQRGDATTSFSTELQHRKLRSCC